MNETIEEIFKYICLICMAILLITATNRFSKEESYKQNIDNQKNLILELKSKYSDCQEERMDFYIDSIGMEYITALSTLQTYSLLGTNESICKQICAVAYNESLYNISTWMDGVDYE